MDSFTSKFSFDKKTKSILVFFIIGLISLIAIGYFIEIDTESKITNNLINEYTSNQISHTRLLSSSIESELKLLSRAAAPISLHDDAINGNWESPKLQEFMDKILFDLNSNHFVESISIIDANGIVVIHSSSTGDSNVLGMDLSFREHVIEAHELRIPYYSNLIIGISPSIPFIKITYPIINQQTDEYIGHIGLMIPSEDFFKEFGNTSNISNEHIIIVGKDSKIISHPMPTLIGESIHGEIIQNNIQQNENINQMFESVESGTPSHAFGFNLNGKAFGSGSPIVVDNSIAYSLFISTPLDSIYSTTADFLLYEKISSAILISIIGASFFLFIFLIEKSRRFRISEKTKRLTAIGELSSRIAHDLKTSLFVIQGNLQLLEMRKGRELDYRDKENFHTINNAVNNMTSIIERVLDHVRMKPVTAEEIGTSSLIEDTLNSMIIPKEVTITKPTQNIIFTCDSKQIQVVFSNLITNSIQSMNKKGHITIRLMETENDLIFEFEDSGPGIPKNILPKIFDPLFTTKASGTGLGLLSCKNIITEHKGSISVKNNPTVFSVKLPKAQEKPNVEITPYTF